MGVLNLLDDLSDLTIDFFWVILFLLSRIRVITQLLSSHDHKWLRPGGGSMPRRLHAPVAVVGVGHDGDAA
jgi:hypothetical protein